MAGWVQEAANAHTWGPELRRAYQAAEVDNTNYFNCNYNWPLMKSHFGPNIAQNIQDQDKRETFFSTERVKCGGRFVF